MSSVSSADPDPGPANPQDSGLILDPLVAKLLEEPSVAPRRRIAFCHRLFRLGGLAVWLISDHLDTKA